MVLDVKTKRVYPEVTPDDGTRILVDRVWPRGKTKGDVAADLWLKEVAPSAALRKWFGHDRSRWEVFKERYFAELGEKSEIVDDLLRRASEGRLTLLYSARDTECNQAEALREYLIDRAEQRDVGDST